MFFDFSIRNFVIALFYNLTAYLLSLLFDNVIYLSDSGVISYFILHMTV